MICVLTLSTSACAATKQHWHPPQPSCGIITQIGRASSKTYEVIAPCVRQHSNDSAARCTFKHNHCGGPVVLLLSGWRPSLPDINAKPFQTGLHVLYLQRHTQQPHPQRTRRTGTYWHANHNCATCFALQSVTAGAHLLAAAIQHDVATCKRCGVALLVLSCRLWADQLRVPF